MSQPADRAAWQPLTMLRERFCANLAGLRGRDPGLAKRLESLVPREEYFLPALEQQIILGRANGNQVETLPNPLPPAAARQVAAKLFPAGQCSEPVLVAGLDQGWLWNLLYHMPVSTPRTPGHRPPLYLLVGDLERMWVVMHLHDWSRLLADARVRLLVGPDAAHQAQQSMCDNPLVPWPKLSVTVDPSVWPAGMNIDSMLSAAHEHVARKFNQLVRRIECTEAAADHRSLAAKLRRGKLRVLGITSLFTTFLQYSMRDWLAAFEQLGHETRLLIEQADHEIANPLHFARVCDEFRPDLILLIDHYRAEFAGLPKNVPCIMWVQDRLPNIFRAPAGAAQGRMDYVLGYGRQECVVSHGYSRERFMPAMVGFNERRFAAQELSDEEKREYSCDVSFVSHASTPAEVLVQTEIEKATAPEAKRFLSDAFERLRSIYDGGGFVTESGQVRAIIKQSMRSCGVQSSDPTALLDFFIQKINNALFRQQAIAWVAEMDLNLNLYGRGWENHPRFKPFARGVADNQNQLAAIYRSSAINLQITPFGAVHQRLFDGLAAGGFFLLRHCSGDTCDQIYREMWQWCQRAGIRSGEQFFRQAPPHVRDMIERIIDLTAVDPSQIPETYFLGLEEVAGAGFTRSPSTLWPEYERVVFATRDPLQSKLRHFLASPDERRELAASMRSRVIDCMSYKAITRRLLDFIADDLDRQFEALTAAA